MNARLNLDDVPVFAEEPQSFNFPDPVLFDSKDPPIIPTSILPTWLGEFAEILTHATQTPPAVAVGYALCTVATCIQGKVDVTTDGNYREPTNLWTLITQPPGSRKTAVVERFTEPLSAWEQDKEQELTSEIMAVRSKIEVENKRIGRLEIEASKEDAEYAHEWLRSNNIQRFKQSELFKTSRFKNSKSTRLKAAIEVLVDRFIISPGELIASGRRPAHWYEVNPAISKSHS